MGTYDEWDHPEPWDRLMDELGSGQHPLVTEIRMGPVLKAHLARAYPFPLQHAGHADLWGVPVVEDANAPEGHIAVHVDAWGVGLTSTRPIAEFRTAGPASSWVRRGV